MVCARSDTSTNSCSSFAERVNVRQRVPITEAQIVRAAKEWVAKSCAPSSTAETRETATKRFIYCRQELVPFLGQVA